MDVKWINPFIDAFMHVMPQLGFQQIEKSSVTLGQGKIKSAGVIMNLGIVGALTGNVVYNIEMETAKAIASKMMMGTVQYADGQCKHQFFQNRHQHQYFHTNPHVWH